MNTILNNHSLKLLSSIYIDENTPRSNEDILFSVTMFNFDLAEIGYTLDKKAINTLSSLSLEDFHKIRASTFETIKELVGDNKKYIPLFSDFPYVKETQDDYLIKRINGYFDSFVYNFLDLKKENTTVLSCGHVIDLENFDLQSFGACPICQRNVEELDYEREYKPLEKVTKLKFISVVSDSDIYSLFKKMLSSQVALSEDYKSFIESLIKVKGASIKPLLPKEIKIKETASFVSSLITEFKNSKHYLLSYNKTATDVLRLAVAFSNGDVSLKENTKFKLNKKQRNLLLFLLDNTINPEENLKKYRNQWLALSKILHVGSSINKVKFSNAYQSIFKLRNKNKEIKTFNSQVEELSVFLKKTYDKSSNKDILLELSGVLKKRPTVFARKIDFMLRHCFKGNGNIVIEEFESVIGAVTNTVLLSLYKRMKERNELEYRVFIPKGVDAKAKVVDMPKGKIYETNRKKLVSLIKKELSSRYAQKEKFENVFVDKSVADIIIPFSLRSTSKNAFSLSRGSKIDFDKDADVLRFFIHWKDIKKEHQNPYKTVDLDLSACYLDENFNLIEEIAYFSYDNSAESSTVYSGDRQDGSGQHGSSEFIDFKINKTNKNNRYIAMFVNSYNRQPFNDFEASAGVMARCDSDFGKPHEAKTVEMNFELNGNTKNILPLIFDIENKKIIWVDIKTNNIFPNEVNYIRNKIEDNLKIFKSFVEYNKIKINMLELIELHKDRFENIDHKKDPKKEYDLEITKDIIKNIPDIISEWI